MTFPGAEPGQLFVYPGAQHLWSDASLPSHDAAATELMMSRVVEFLAKRISPAG